MEDLDGPRVKAGADQAAMEDLQWLGLDWDTGPVYQKPRIDRYREVLEKLAQQGLAYPCICSRKDVLAAASAPHAGEEGPVYPGTCRGRFPTGADATRQSGTAPSWRFAVPEGSEVGFEDRFRGACRIQVDRDLGDFVIWKRDGEPAYQLAVVVDDADQGMTEILRGDDLLSSAARQILLYQHLQWPVPRFAHVPLVIGTDGRRLAKRHGDTTLRRFRELGRSPIEVLQWLAFSCGHPEWNRLQCPADGIEGFDLAKVPDRPWVWQGELLDPWP